MKEGYICPFCGSTYVRTDDKMVLCTQCRKRIFMSRRKETKVIMPEFPEERETEKAVKNPEQRLREIPEVETK